MSDKASKSGKRLPRLLVLASTYPRWANDAEPGFVHELSKQLITRFDITVLCPHAPGAAGHEHLEGVQIRRYRYAPARLERLVNDGGIITNLRRNPWTALLVPSFMLGQLLAAVRLLRSQPPDVIHAHWIIPQGLIAVLATALSRANPPIVVTSHGADLFALHGKLLTAIKKFVLRRASGISVVSEAMRGRIATLGANKNEVLVAPMGTDLTRRFHPDPAHPRKKAELLFVGRLVEKKGLRHLIQALPLVLEQHPEATLVVVGFGPEEAACRALAADLGLQHQVHFVGATPQSQLSAFYRSATTLVAPFVIADSGDQEGLGLVMVEALGCHCPVITTKIPAVQQVFGGRWPPYAATSGDPNSLAEQIIRLLDEPAQAERWAAVVRDELLPRFDHAEVARIYGDFLYSRAHDAAAMERPS